MLHIPAIKHADIKTMWECQDYGGEWVNAKENFDNVPIAMISLFDMISTEGWTQIMWNAVDSTQPY